MKYDTCAEKLHITGRPPSRGRGLKSLRSWYTIRRTLSPPLAGAWIEIAVKSPDTLLIGRPPSRGRGLKSMSSEDGTALMNVAPPRGGVD